MLSAAGALWRWPLEGYDAMYAVCLRVGTVMAVLWLACDQLRRLPAWVLAGVPALLVIAAVRPRWLIVAIPIVLALAILSPKRRTRRGA